MADKNEHKIKIQIGRLEFDYGLFKTDAPAEYDGFGTFAVMQSGKTRYVLIQEHHENWQVMRNGSGGYLTEPCDKAHLTKAAEDKLIGKLWKNEVAK